MATAQEIKVTRQDFDGLRKELKELAQAQKRTEQTVKELAQAQKRTDQAVKELAEAQKRTDQAVKELAEAQKRTEQRVEELAEAQKRTEQRVEELAEAQKRTEKALTNLAQEVGRLSRNIGYGLEDIAHVVLPGYLHRHFSIQMGEFERHFFLVDRMHLEVNLYAEGKRNGQKLAILGEAKSRIHAREVRRFQSIVEKVTSQLPYPPFKVMFAYIVFPDAMEEAKRHDIVLVASYQR